MGGSPRPPWPRLSFWCSGKAQNEVVGRSACGKGPAIKWTKPSSVSQSIPGATQLERAVNDVAIEAYFACCAKQSVAELEICPRRSDGEATGEVLAIDIV
jgi:hypothetical protein